MYENTSYEFTLEVWRETPIDNRSFIIITKIIEYRVQWTSLWEWRLFKKIYVYILNLEQSTLFFGPEFSFDCIIVCLKFCSTIEFTLEVRQSEPLIENYGFFNFTQLRTWPFPHSCHQITPISPIVVKIMFKVFCE